MSKVDCLCVFGYTHTMEIKDIEHLAHLARIDIDASEKEALLSDMKSILGYIDTISEVDTSAVDLTLPLHRNIMRDDVVTNETGSNTDAILSNAPDSQDGFVKVRKIL